MGANPDGSYITRNIEDVQVGDWVLARDQNDPDAEPTLQQVTNVFQREVTSLRVISYQDASGNVETISTTDEHPFYAMGRGWVAAADLRTGDVVTTPTGGTAIVVFSSAQLLDEPIFVYNIEVASGHTYFVEDGNGLQTPVWVHNDCTKGNPLKALEGSNAAKTELMHLLPQSKKLAKFFKAAGLAIEDFVIPLQKGMHRLKAFNGVHTGKGINNWNGAWKAFFEEAKGNRSKKEILDKLSEMRKLFGI